MTSGDRSTALTALARTGFSQLTEADTLLGELEESVGVDRADAMQLAQRVADPDRALRAILQVARRDVAAVRTAAADPGAWRALWDIVGASDGFAEFYLRHPDEIAHLSGAGLTLPDEPTMRAELLASVGDDDGFAADATDAAWVALRVRYRRLLARIAAYDLGQDDPAAAIDVVSSSLADLAGAALEASLSVARSRVSGAGPGAFRVSRSRRPGSPSSRWARPARAS